MYRFYCDLHEKLCDDGLNPTMQQYEQVEQGNYTVSRVDINETWQLANQAEVLAWIRSAEIRYVWLGVVVVFLKVILFIGVKIVNILS